MIKHKPYTKSIASSSKIRSKSIYRGDYSHTVSMQLKLDCDLSPETYRQTKENNKTYKQMFKQNRAQKYKDSLRIIQTSYSGKKTQREDTLQKSNKKPTNGRQIQTERCLKQFTNIQNLQHSFKKSENPIINLRINSIKKQTRGQENQKVAINQQDMKQILIKMKKMYEQNCHLKRQIKLFHRQQDRTVMMALHR